MIQKLRNLGEASSRMLAAADINSVTQLQALGSAAAYVAVKQAGCTPSLNLLWAIEGALTDRDWQEVAKNDRLSLLMQVEELEKSQKIKPAQPLQEIPGIGPRLSRMLMELGYRHVADLSNENPEQMYEKLCNLRGQPIDRCVLYTFRCAVYYASHTRRDPELLKWWNWKR